MHKSWDRNRMNKQIPDADYQSIKYQISHLTSLCLDCLLVSLVRKITKTNQTECEKEWLTPIDFLIYNWNYYELLTLPIWYVGFNQFCNSQ